MDGLLGRVPSGVVAAINHAGTPSSARKSERIFAQGAASRSVYLVTGGVVKLSKPSRRGGQSLLALRGAGDLVGEHGVLDGRPRGSDAHALVDTNFLIIDRRQFLDLLARLPELSFALFATLSTQLRAATAYIADLSAELVPVLVARRIVELAGDPRLAPLRSDPLHGIEASLSQADLAAWAGVSDRALGVTLQALRDNGLIETGRMRLKITDLEGLRRCAALAVV